MLQRQILSFRSILVINGTENEVTIVMTSENEYQLSSLSGDKKPLSAFIEDANESNTDKKFKFIKYGNFQHNSTIQNLQTHNGKWYQVRNIFIL